MMNGDCPQTPFSELRERLVKSIETSRVLKKEEDRTEEFETEYPLVKVIDWPKERPHTDHDFLDGFHKLEHTGPLIQESQDYQLMEDLISCFLGFNGKFIVANPLTSPFACRTFTISGEIVMKSRDLIEKALKMASSYSFIVRFIQSSRQLECGRVNQALGATMDKMMVEYTSFVLSIEEELRQKTLSLHVLWFKVQQSLRTLELLERAAESVISANAKGGKTLSVLHSLTVDLVLEASERRMAEQLLIKAAVPFMESVSRWITQGVIYDPYNEFMIVGNPLLEASKDSYSDEYWLRRYQVRKSLVPSFLESVSEKILNCGKYLNVVHDVAPSGDFENDGKWVVKYDPSSESDCLAVIESAYEFASSCLLGILVNRYKVVERIASAKRYMLCEQGDFVHQLLETCEEDLSKPISEIEPARLVALVELAVRIPSTADDPFRDGVSALLDPQHLSSKVIGGSRQTDEMIGFDGFTLSLETDWPVTLVFNRKTTLYLQTLFKRSLYCKYVERLLSRVWISHKSFTSVPLSDALAKVFYLRNNMLSAVRNFEYYMSDDVVEPNWIEFLSQVAQVGNFDDLLHCHRNFLEGCITGCMLTKPELLEAFKDLLDICRNFALYALHDERFDISLVPDLPLGDPIDYFLDEFEKRFLGLLKRIRDLSFGDSDKLIKVMERQDFNFYFSHKLDNMDSLSMISDG